MRNNVLSDNETVMVRRMSVVRPEEASASACFSNVEPVSFKIGTNSEGPTNDSSSKSPNTSRSSRGHHLLTSQCSSGLNRSMGKSLHLRSMLENSFGFPWNSRNAPDI